MKLIFTCAATLFLITNYCLADVFDTIQDTNTARAGKYNAPLNPTIDSNDPMDLLKLSPETTKIDNLLTKNVNTKVHATREQQKKALQAVFSTEIIYGDARPSYLDGISTTSDLYGHCYVLEYSALLARDCIRSMLIPGVNGISISSSVYKDLCKYSGLDGNTLTQWFFQIYERHMPGTMARFTRQQPEIAKLAFPKALPAKYSSLDKMSSPAPEAALTTSVQPSMKSRAPYFNYSTATPEERERYSQIAVAKISQNTQLPFDQLLKSAAQIPQAQYTHVTQEMDLMGPLMEELVGQEVESRIRQSLGLNSSQKIPENMRRQLEEAKANALQVARSLATSLATPVPPTVSVPFKGNWTESFQLKNGETIHHTPENVRLGFMTAGKGITMRGGNINGKTYNIQVLTDSTRDEFVAALTRDGNL